MPDQFEGLSDKYLEREWDRLYKMAQETATSLAEVKAEIMRRSLVDFVGGDREDRS